MKKMEFMKRGLKNSILGAKVGAVGGGILMATILFGGIPEDKRLIMVFSSLITVATGALLGAIIGFACTRPNRNKFFAVMLMSCLVMLSTFIVFPIYFTLLLQISGANAPETSLFANVIFSIVLGAMPITFQIIRLFEKSESALGVEKT